MASDPVPPLDPGREGRRDPDEEVLFGLGANVGDPLNQLARALEELGAIVSILAVSDVYRTEPVGFRDQPDFYNLAVRARSGLLPEDLLARALAVEHRLGRERSFPNAPRTIDIDLLAVGDRIVNTADLRLPHPRLHERTFVLVPLVEIVPDWRHPTLGSTASELLAVLGAPAGIERMGGLRGLLGSDECG